MAETTARAERSCKRCYRRKKRCDKTLPECRACKHARELCSFLHDTTQVASYPIVYVQGLERRVQELEAQLTSQTLPGSSLPCFWGQNVDILFQSNGMLSDTPPDHSAQNQIQILENSAAGLPISSTDQAVPEKTTDNLPEELRILSLQAAAERYLGSSPGLSFAKLTQAVPQQLSPDHEGFVFDHNFSADLQQAPDRMSSLTPALTDLYTSFVSPLAFDSAPGITAIGGCEEPTEFSLLEQSHINYILDFYFAHSHTLYPIIQKNKFMTSLWRIYSDPLDPLAQSPLWQFRIWMVLAIGSTTYCSVSLTDETEPVRLYNRAMTYFETAMGCGDLAALEILMLQVSYSFFNKIGPNTWFFVGVAARIATGMGLHPSEIYHPLAVDVAEQQKRLFFSLYMIDRVVSLSLGRPFAIQDEDITVEPIADADDENIGADGIRFPGTLESSTMAISLHILRLRRIAGRIGSQVHSVHSVKYSQNQSAEQREETIENLHRELIEWRRSMPFPLPDLQAKVPHLCSSWFDLDYYTHIIMLYRPSPLIPTLDAPKIKTLAEASGMAIRQAINLHRQQRFAYNWLNLVAVFNSLLSLIYTTAALSDNLSPPVLLDHSKVNNDLELVIELLDAFCNKFPSAKNIQDMIQVVMARLRLYAPFSSVVG